MTDADTIRRLEEQVAALRAVNNAQSDAYDRGHREGRLELAEELYNANPANRFTIIDRIITQHEEEACRSED